MKRKGNSIAGLLFSASVLSTVPAAPVFAETTAAKPQVSKLKTTSETPAPTTLTIDIPSVHTEKTAAKKLSRVQRRMNLHQAALLELEQQDDTEKEDKDEPETTEEQASQDDPAPAAQTPDTPDTQSGTFDEVQEGQESQQPAEPADPAESTEPADSSQSGEFSEEDPKEPSTDDKDDSTGSFEEEDPEKPADPKPGEGSEDPASPQDPAGTDEQKPAENPGEFVEEPVEDPTDTDTPADDTRNPLLPNRPEQPEVPDEPKGNGVSDSEDPSADLLPDRPEPAQSETPEPDTEVPAQPEDNGQDQTVTVGPASPDVKLVETPSSVTYVPVTSTTITVKSISKRTNKKMTIAGRGNFNLLPDYTNKKAWKQSVSPYNTPSLWGQCTWFAWGRFYELYGFNPGFSGNGYECVGQLIAAHPDKFEFSTTPAAGAVFSADAAHNHVGIVLDYDEKNDILTIQEGNLDGISNADWMTAIDDYRTIKLTSSDIRTLYGNVTYAVPKEGVKFVNSDDGKSSGTMSIKVKSLKALSKSRIKEKVYSVTGKEETKTA